MRLPTRRSQKLKLLSAEEQSHELTPAAIERLKRDLDELERSHKLQAIQDVSVAVQKGDLSENAEYQEARARLSRIEGRIFSLKERLKNAIPISQERDPLGRIQVGSTVTVVVDDQRRTFHIVGSQETDPSRGRISYLSPLGAALLRQVSGDSVSVNDKMYQIVNVQ